MPSENEMFYGVIQRGLDKWNAAFFCGSAAVLRRAALEEVGGFSGISITEDCETALDLHSRGWNSLYVDRPMISGLQPETFASFIGQRSRWCRGMFQIFLLKNPMFKAGLSLSQKICYLSNMSYWFFPLFRLPFLIAPFLYIWFSLQITIANLHEFVAYTTLYMVVNVMMQNYMYGSVRWPFISELYEFVQSIFLSRGLLSVIANPRKPTFNVTDKGQSLEKDFLSELAMPYFVIFGFILAEPDLCGRPLLHRGGRQRPADRRQSVELLQLAPRRRSPRRRVGAAGHAAVAQSSGRDRDRDRHRAGQDRHHIDQRLQRLGRGRRYSGSAAAGNGGDPERPETRRPRGPDRAGDARVRQRRRGRTTGGLRLPEPEGRALPSHRLDAASRQRHAGGLPGQASQPQVDLRWHRELRPLGSRRSLSGASRSCIATWRRHAAR